jgi:hypothetical protein
MSKFRVYYERFQTYPNLKGEWQNLTKDFDSEEEADVFIRRIKQNVIVKWYTKSKVYSNTSHG